MTRPNPDALLASMQQSEQKAARGHLKIFFGMAPGVGKTYAMLSEARERAQNGTEVVAGVVVTHGRRETLTLVEGLEIIPPRVVEHGKSKLEEFDIDGALRRNPQLLLVDELAHTNAPGSRHPKRWQDVLELLERGVSVFTTVNVQHLESLNDVVAQITGVRVRETIPDTLLERADEIELIDLSPSELQQRLKEGKVYIPQSVENALKNFFREGNLIALRELALRRTAERVDAQMQRYRREKRVESVWAAGERLLVCIAPGPMAPRLIRSGRRLAASLKAPWVVACVEPSAGLSDVARANLFEALKLAENLGAETTTLSGDKVPQTVLDFAREGNFSKIIVGKPQKTLWRERLFGSTVDGIVRGSGEIDVYVITGEISKKTERKPRQLPDWSSLKPQTEPRLYLFSFLVVLLCTGLARTMFAHLAPPNLTLIYLLGAVFCSLRLGRGPGVLASLLSVLAFDFLFVPPYYTLAVSDLEYFLTFAFFLVASLTVSSLTSRLRDAADEARDRERRTAALYSLSRDLAATRGADNVKNVALRHLRDGIAADCALFLPADDLFVPHIPPGHSASFASDAREVAVARWAFDRSQIAGAGTDTLPASRGIYFPLKGSNSVVGVLGVEVKKAGDERTILTLDPARRFQLEAIASQIAIALERVQLAEAAQSAKIQAETQRLRTNLLSSVSHDLRTPLASIMGAASSLLENSLPEPTKTELAASILDESQRLHRLTSNLLEMTRLQSGAVRVNKELQPIEEVIGAALSRMESRLEGREVTTDVPADLPPVPFDAILIEQVLLNLLDNALKYSPEGTPIHVAALKGHETVMVEVSDRGRGLPVNRENEIFEPFFRASNAEEGRPIDGKSAEGTGLGLAIARAIVEAHSGSIWAENRPRGGAVVRFTLPLKSQP